MANPVTPKLALAVAAGLLAMSGTAVAHDQKFEEMDTDGNGAITVAEADAVARDLHGRADRDGDGRVTSDELESLYRELARESGKGHGPDGAAHAGDTARGSHDAEIRDAVAEMDADGDGTISRDEFMDTSREKHDMSDLDGDGSVTRAEFEEAKRQAKDRKRHHDGSGRTDSAGAGGH